MDAILAKSKEYEVVIIEKDPAYQDFIEAIEIVKKFIIDNGLVLYGGLAIDYALRLQGDNIYPDNLPPDLDMYSPKNVEHSYQLADILYFRGYKEARAINAEHMETMRVDVMDNHFIADITYRPPEIFARLSHLEYNGMKIIHPLFQRIDLHSSLAFPYDNTPREVIFARWNKDIERFNKLNQHYPVKIKGESLPARVMKIDLGMRRYIFCGFAAYSVIYSEFVKSMKRFDAEIPGDIIPASLSFDETSMSFDTLNQKFEIVHFDPEKAANEIKLTSVHMFEPFVNMIPERIEGRLSFGDVIIYSTKERLVSTNSIKLGQHSLRIVNIQYLLKHFISLYFVNKKTPKIANTYLERYLSLLKMIAALESVLVEKASEETAIEIAKESPLFPTIVTYGNDNINLARKIALNRLYNELDGETKYKIPQNYYPGRSIPAGRQHPEFNPAEVEFFQEEGREIKSTLN